MAEFEWTVLAATRAAALGCQRWIGRGDSKEADGAATDAMRAVLAEAPGRGTVVVGEGAKDEAPMLYDGEELGAGSREFDIAVDPLECTTLCAKGLPGSLATISIADGGTMAALGVSFYMEKLVGPPAVCDAVDLTLEPEENLKRASEALGVPVEGLRVVVLDKPRHEELTERLHKAGASVISPPDGDVAGALAALVPGGGADLLMGTGGTPEGLLTACAVRALGGCMQARLAPQEDEEAEALAEEDLDSDHVYELDELVGSETLFAATGVTGGELLRRPWISSGQVYTESLVVTNGTVRRVVEAQDGEPPASNMESGAQG